MKPIETRYGGVLFRSRLEARWAVFFTRLGIEWEYEPQGFHVGRAGATYLPDFFLRQLGLYVEVKPAAADHVDPDGVRRWEEFAGALAVAAHPALTDTDAWAHLRDDAYRVPVEIVGRRAAMFCGPIPDPDTVDAKGPPRAGTWFESGIFIIGDWHYAWCACPSGAHFDIQHEARGGRIFCGCPRIADDRYHTGDDPRILNAYGAGRGGRFEHGQAAA